MQPFDTRPLAGPLEPVPTSQLWQPGPAGSFPLTVAPGTTYDPMTINSPVRNQGEWRNHRTAFGLLALGVVLGVVLR